MTHVLTGDNGDFSSAEIHGGQAVVSDFGMLELSSHLASVGEEEAELSADDQQCSSWDLRPGVVGNHEVLGLPSIQVEYRPANQLVSSLSS